MIKFIFKLFLLLALGSGIIYWLSTQNILNVRINRAVLERVPPSAEEKDADWVDLCAEIRTLSRSALELHQKLLEHLAPSLNNQKELKNDGCYQMIEEEN